MTCHGYSVSYSEYTLFYNPLVSSGRRFKSWLWCVQVAAIFCCVLCVLLVALVFPRAMGYMRSMFLKLSRYMDPFFSVPGETVLLHGTRGLKRPNPTSPTTSRM